MNSRDFGRTWPRPTLYPLMILVLLAAHAGAHAQSPTGPLADGSGLQTSVSIDLVGQAGDAYDDATSRRFTVREAELVVHAPIDPYFDGQLNLAAHQEPGTDVALFEIHEAFLGSSRLIPRSRFRIGQFFLGWGRLNQIHRHDWPFVSGPRVQREFFGVEGVIDTGLEYSWLLPTPLYLELTAGLTSGWTFLHTHAAGEEGHAHAEGEHDEHDEHAHAHGERPRVPTHYLRLATYADLAPSTGLQVALNYVGRRDAEGEDARHFGLDLVARRREGTFVSWFLQGELWVKRATGGPAGDSTRAGAYLFPELGLGPRTFLGVRGDWFRVLGTGSGTWAAVPTLSFRPSEFTVLRAAWTAQWDRSPGATTLSHTGQLQARFILGAHPAHEF